MKKKMMKFITAVAVVAMLQPVFGAVTIFNRSLPNQAGLGYDSVLDTWDYLTLPGLYSEQKESALSFGFSNDGTLTNQNSFFGGGHFNVGLPLYLVAGIRNANNVTSNEGSTTTANPNGPTVTDASDIFTDLNNSFKIAIGSNFGTLGVQLFADLNANGRSGKWAAASNETTAGNLKTAEVEYRAGGSYDRYGINVGSKSGDMVWNVGAALRSSRGSTATYTSVDGTVKQTFTNTRYANTGAFSAFAADADFTALLDTAANNYINKRTGLVVSSFGWLPMPILTDKDVLGWIVDYQSTAALGHEDTKFQNVNGTTDWTGTFKATPGGVGDITINPYLTIPRSLGEAGNLYINIDLKAAISMTSLETKPELTGKVAGTDLTPAQIADGFASVGATCGDRRLCDGVKTERSSMELTLGLPIIAELNINKSLQWIIGTFPKLTYKTFEQTTTTTDLSTPTAGNDTKVVSKADNGTIATAVDFTTGLKFSAADNFTVALLMSANNRLALDTFSVAANYIFK